MGNASSAQELRDWPAKNRAEAIANHDCESCGAKAGSRCVTTPDFKHLPVRELPPSRTHEPRTWAAVMAEEAREGEEVTGEVRPLQTRR